MRVLIPGGTGQVGRILTRALDKDGHDVVILSRAATLNGCWKTVSWDGETRGPWIKELEGCDVVINLAGRSVNCRYGMRNRRLIMDSRVRSTRILGRAMADAACPPRVWLQASTATIYAHRYDSPNDEATGILGGQEAGAPESWRFSIDVARAWEQAALEAPLPATRRVLMRSAMTMSPDPGGVFAALLGLVRLGMGGKSGTGRQYVSWIHDQDFVRAIYWLIDHPELEGPVNLASPFPVTNAEFMQALRQTWGIRLGLPQSAWMLEAGTFFMRTESELILKSRRVIPGRLLQSGFVFGFPHWPLAARDLCRRWREREGEINQLRRAKQASYTV